MGCFILQRLDGEHDRASLEADLREALQSGLMFVEQEDKHPHPSPEEVAEMVDWALRTCSVASLLVA